MFRFHLEIFIRGLSPTSLAATQTLSQAVPDIFKLKADQINILRKQYDAFLEEDKKRKERNECILEKLDQIRLSNTVTRYKSNIYLDHRVSFNCSPEAPTAYAHLQTNNATKQPSSVNSITKYKDALIPTEIDVLAKPLDERYLINEISKKYILIPKLRSIVSEDYMPRAIKQDNNNESDWKSKYSILDTLKQNEKGEIGDSANDRNENYLDHIPSKEPKLEIDEKARVSVKEKDEMYSKQYASKPQRNMTCPENEVDMKLNYTADAKNEGMIETERFNTSPKLNSNISSPLKPGLGFNDKSQNIYDKSKDLTEGQQRLQIGQGQAASEMTTPDYTYPTLNDHEPVLFKNIDDKHNDTPYADKHENEASEKFSLGEDIDREVANTMKAAVQETANENQIIGASETLEYPTENVYAQDFALVQDVALADGVNVHPESYAEQQEYLAQSDQYVSEPAAEFEQVYQPGEHPIAVDQYVAEQTATAEQVYLPGANQTLGNEHYVPEPTSTEQVYMPDHLQVGDLQHVSEPTVAEQAYVSGDKTQTNVGQPVSQPVAADTEPKDYTIENEGFQITSEQTHDLPVETVNSEIAEFEAEQSQMFYSEQANYDYNQTAEGGYNPENAGYDPVLYYQQQQAAYPVEINEHEETSTRYDPSYEQQYAGQAAELEYAEHQQYGDQLYEQQQYNEQQYAEQPYEEQQQSDFESTMHVYDQVQSVDKQPIMEQVQQELDNEEFNALNKTGAGDVVQESTVNMQNSGDTAPAEPGVEQKESPQVA